MVKGSNFNSASLSQFQSFLSSLSSDASASGERISSLDQDLLRDLTELRLSMADKGDSSRRLQQHLLQVPRDQVCPQFVRLARTWQGLQEEAVVLSRINACREKLQEHLVALKKLPLKVRTRKWIARKRPSEKN